MKIKLLYIITLLLPFTLTSFRMAENESPDLPLKGFLNITVESNVNRVLFSYPISNANMHNSNARGTGRMTDIVVPVKDFRCDNRIAYKDFLTLLKADQYPDLVISIPRSALRQMRNEKEFTLHNVMINIAGVSREYDITCETEPSGTDSIMVGTIAIELSDLDIKPPVKYFGMVKIKDEVIVKFGLGIQDQSLARK